MVLIYLVRQTLIFVWLGRKKAEKCNRKKPSQYNPPANISNVALNKKSTFFIPLFQHSRGSVLLRQVIRPLINFNL